MDRLKTLLQILMQSVQQFKKNYQKTKTPSHTHTHTHTNILNLHVMINKNVLLLLCTVAKLFLSIFNRVPPVVGDEKVCRLVSQVMREFSSVLLSSSFHLLHSNLIPCARGSSLV